MYLLKLGAIKYGFPVISSKEQPFDPAGVPDPAFEEYVSGPAAWHPTNDKVTTTIKIPIFFILYPIKFLRLTTSDRCRP